MVGCIVRWVGGGWVGSGQITKNLKIVDSIKIIQFCLMGGCGWLGGWVGQWVGSGQITKNLIDLDIIKIIQFCLKICDL